MDFATFFQANQNIPFDGPLTGWAMRYTGTLDDYRRFRKQIEDSFRRHVERHDCDLLRIASLEDGDGFYVLGIAARKGSR